MELELLKSNGKGAGSKVKLPKHVFGVEPNENAVYLAVKAQRANARQGTAASKTRTMVSGGGRKPWRQKGRGAARAGTTRSPLWVGGGRVFGPHPRDYGMQLPRKVKKLARLSVYSDRAKAGRVHVIEDFKLKQPKTKELYTVLKSLELDGKKVLLLTAEYDPDVLRAGRNIPRLIIRQATTESTYDLLNCESILIQQGAVKKLSDMYK